METSSDRLRRARIRAKFKSARAAALKFGWVPSTYSSHENGQTPVPPEMAEVYARAFRTKAAYILTGEGGTEALNIVPIMGQIGAGAEILPEVEQFPPDGLGEIELPFDLKEDAVAFEIKGESMMPRYDPGTVIVCTAYSRDPERLLGEEVAVKTATGRRYLKTLQAGSKRGLFDLESFNARPIRDAKLAWVGSILAIVPATVRKPRPQKRTRAG